MKKALLALICFVVLFQYAPIHAEVFSVEPIKAGFELPEGVYQTVLTPDTLQAHEDFIKAQGGTLETYAAAFKAEGILVKAYDPANQRVFVLTARQDVDAKKYFDIDKQTPETRAVYRQSHGKDGAYAVLGYKYDSVEWKNFENVGRFLMLRYTFREGGELVCRGFQRRTIRNGYTITLDMQVYGRMLAGKDNTALNTIFDSFHFSELSQQSKFYAPLEETMSAPIETNVPDFTMKGKTSANASLTAVVSSFSTNKAEVFKTTAKANGVYTLPVKLPQEGIYLMTFTVEIDGKEALSKVYDIKYQSGLIPVAFSSAPPEQLFQESFKVAGNTDKGVNVTLTVNGKESAKKVGANKAFSFTVNTKTDGEYKLVLSFTKDGAQTRSFSYTVIKGPPEPAETPLPLALTPSYDQLISKKDNYDGKPLQFDGYLISNEEKAGEWQMLFALRKTEGAYADYLLLASNKQVQFPLETKVRAYGTLVGYVNDISIDGKEAMCPKLEISLTEALTETP